MTKKRRYFLVAGVSVVCVGLALALLAFLPEGQGVTKANFERIQVGMSLAEVEHLFGAPGRAFHGFPLRANVAELVWAGEDGSFALIEFTDHLVVDKVWHPSTETIVEKMRRWLRLPK